MFNKIAKEINENDFTLKNLIYPLGVLHQKTPCQQVPFVSFVAEKLQSALQYVYSNNKTSRPEFLIKAKPAPTDVWITRRIWIKLQSGGNKTTGPAALILWWCNEITSRTSRQKTETKHEIRAPQTNAIN